MNRATMVRTVIVFAVLAVSILLTVNVPARLGLDLRGGVQLVLETRDSPTVEANAESTDRALEVLRRRVDGLGVTEPTIARSGERRIIVELPGLQDPDEAAQVLGRTAQLTFHPVLGLAEATPSPSPTASPGASPTASPGASATASPAASPTASPAKSRSSTASPSATASPSPSPSGTAAPGSTDGEQVLPDESGQPLRLGPAALTGADVSRAQAGSDPQSGMGWFVTVDLRGGGADKWQKLTADAACADPGDPRRRVAIVLDNEVISSPQVDPSVACGVGITGGTTQITGNFTFETANELALLISGGSLPVPVEVIEQRTVGPTLGAEAIEASTWASIIGVALTAIFIIVVYRLFGMLAAIALACYGLISYAALLGIGATLTLPGLAGFVLAIGMAVDANVLVFERAREEYAANPRKGLRPAVAGGFRNALSAIADSNITTLLAAGLLFFLASGPVRGFGVTLSIGVLASMVSALLITRVFAEFTVGRRAVRRHPLVTGLAKPGRVRTWLLERNPDLMRHGRRWLFFSAVVVALAVAGIAVRGLNLGVEFTGGRLMEYSTTKPVDPEQARSALADAGYPRVVVNASGNGNLTVRSGSLTNEEEGEIEQVIGKLGGGVEQIRDELIGPTLGEELRRNALIALVVALAIQMLYLAFRFKWTFSVAAVAAMAHDVIILIGAFAWMGKPIDGVFLAALLTIIGYSVNDSVVVFDRVREMLRDPASRKRTFASVANSALLQTVPRTVNTGMGALFILIALAILGGDTLTDFAIALLIGVIVGTYSSVFTATPIAIELDARNKGTAVRPAARRPVAAKK